MVDLGCRTFVGEEESIGPLVQRFHPDELLGFDPFGELDRYNLDGTIVELSPEAAWTYDGELELGVGSFRQWDATAMREKNGRSEWGSTRTVPCFDFALWLSALSARSLVVKMDVEGAEFPLLDVLHEDGTDSLIDLLLIEWHDEKLGGDYPARRARLEAELRCAAIEEWS